MNASTGLVILALGVVTCISAKTCSENNPKNEVAIWAMACGLLLVLFVAIMMEYNCSSEGFFFEVSPNRASCLKQQVSRHNFGQKRGCGCCGRGTMGGIPPNYAEWLNNEPDTSQSRWHRPDFVSTFSNGEEASCNRCSPPSYIQMV